MKQKFNIEEKLEEIKNAGIEVVELKHAYRLNGVVDVWKREWMTFEIPIIKYERHQGLRTAFAYALEVLPNYEKRPAFKKLPSGRISMQEFRHNKAALDHERRKAGILPEPEPESPPQVAEKPKKAKGIKGGNTKITFGKHKGEKLKDLPLEYLLWLFENIPNLSFAPYIKERLKLTP